MSNSRPIPSPGGM